MQKIVLFLAIVLLVGCKKDNTNTQNHMPKAIFSVIPERAKAGDEILFDASSVSDKEDPAENLEIRWSFTGDQNFTPYTTVKTANYTFDEEGVYFPKLHVKDTKGIIDSISGIVIIVYDLNNLAPYIPIQVSPLEWQDWVEPSLTFKWKSGGDPEDDELMFDVWLGVSKSTMEIIASDVNTYSMVEGVRVYETNYSGLLLGQDYYWQVAAKDPNGNYTRGWIWKFITKPG